MRWHLDHHPTGKPPTRPRCGDQYPNAGEPIITDPHGDGLHGTTNRDKRTGNQYASPADRDRHGGAADEYPGTYSDGHACPAYSHAEAADADANLAHCHGDQGATDRHAHACPTPDAYGGAGGELLARLPYGVHSAATA